MGKIEHWSAVSAITRATAAKARELEDLGFDGMTMTDSQNKRADAFVCLTVAATVTQHLGLATGVTNPFTRHPAALAGGFATLQELSNGRAVLGIGRGDSSLAHIGLAPAPIPLFEETIEVLQMYLRGEGVPLDRLPKGSIAPVATLKLAQTPESSRLLFMDTSLPKVPVDIAASGPKVIGVAARLADRITFAVGADASRVKWAIEIARNARVEAGLDPDTLSLGAFVSLAVDDDPDRARRLAGGSLAVNVRFNAMHGRAVGPADEKDAQELERVARVYEMSRHGSSGSPQDAAIPDELAHRFGIFGPPSYCVERLQQLVELGINRFVIIGPREDTDPDGVSDRRYSEVLQKVTN